MKKQLNRLSTYQPLRKDLPALPEKGRSSLFPSDAATLIGGTEEDLTHLSKEESAEALTIISGRPPLQALVPSFVTASSGRTLIVGEPSLPSIMLSYRLLTFSYLFFLASPRPFDLSAPSLTSIFCLSLRTRSHVPDGPY